MAPPELQPEPPELQLDTLTADDIQVSERYMEENGQRFTVSYASAIGGLETSKIAYKDLRRVCVQLKVRYYKNRTKDKMLELIAQMKLHGKVPDSYRLPTKRSARHVAVDVAMQETKRLRTEVESDGDSASPTSLMHSENRADLSNLVNPAPLASPAFVVAAPRSQRQQQGLEQRDHAIERQTMEALAERAVEELVDQTAEEREEEGDAQTDLEMPIKDRVHALNMLQHVRKELAELERQVHEYARYGNLASASERARAYEELKFYLAERRALMRRLERTRFH